MRFVVVNKTKNGAEMHVLANGRLSFYGKPRKFLTKDAALTVAQEWADTLPTAKMIIRRVN